MKKKVLYIVTNFDVGGAQKYVSQISANVDPPLFETKIICGGKDVRWLSNKVRPWLLFINDWVAIAELIRIFRKERPNIIHLNSSKAGIIGSLAAFLYNKKTPAELQTKVVFTAHGWIFNPTNTLAQPIRWACILLHKFAALFQDKIICVSQYDYNLALKYKIASADKLITIHNGINPNIKFLNKETARKRLLKRLAVNVKQSENEAPPRKAGRYQAKFFRSPANGASPRFAGVEENKKQDSPNLERYPLNPKLPWLGSIGRLVKEKNYETFIETAALMPEAYFFIIGAGPEKEKIELKIKLLTLNNNVRLIEPIGDDALYLKAFDIFIMTSIKEGLPYILLEAMAAELPIVVTEAGGMPEVIEDHGNGLMVSQKNPELLAKAIKGILGNKPFALELSKMAKKALIEKFSLKKMVDKTSAIYREL